MVAAAQAVINAATAVQDRAIARLAAIEPDWAEDGTIVEVHHAPGHVALDAADIVAPALAASHAQAQRRVDLAVRLAAGRVPRVDDTRALPEHTGLDGLHDAMREGRLDGYRAGVVAHELAEAPADVAQTVVAALDPYLGVEPAAALRRRCRRLLARISPDLLRQRAERVRSECGLRRWVAEPGVDTWWGTFPSEDAAGAWAAIDDLARRLVADGVCTGIEQARAKALTDLVLAHSTVTVSVVLTVPAGGSAANEAAPIGKDDDLVEVRGLRPTEPSLVPRSWLDAHLAPGSAAVECDARQRRSPRLLVDDIYRPTETMAAVVRARDGRCRFPGCSVAARFCDLDHVRPWPAGPTAADNLACLCRRHHRIKQRPGWRVRMMPGAVLEWTDPTGRVRTTTPIDALAVAGPPRHRWRAGPDPRGRRHRGRHPAVQPGGVRLGTPRSSRTPAPAPAPRRVLPNPRAPPRARRGRPTGSASESVRTARAAIPLARPPTVLTAAPSLTGMELEFSGVVWHWRGPSPYHFVSVPDEECGALEAVSPQVSYGWGMIPVAGRVGGTSFTTALWPKDGGYVVPLKDAVRRAEDIELDDVVTVRLTVAGV